MSNHLKALVVAPGVVVHELGHILLCRLSGVQVRDFVLFRIGSPAGYVSHAPPRLLRQNLAISSGPLLVSSVVAAALFVLAARLSLTRPVPWWLAGVLVSGWLGWSIALEAWPSAGDAVALHRSAATHIRGLNPAAFFGLLLAWTLQAANASRRVGGHWLYAGLLAAAAAQLASARP